VESTSELPKVGHAIDRELAIDLMGWALIADDATCGTWIDGPGHYVLVPSEKHFELLGEVVGPNSFAPSRSWISVPTLWRRLTSLGYYVTMKSGSDNWTCRIDDMYDHVSVDGVNPLEVFCRAALKSHKELTATISLKVD